METTETVTELTAESTGTWLVTTQGTRHLWNLDNLTYERFPAPDSLTGRMLGDCAANPILKIEAYPLVGHSFLLWFRCDNILVLHRMSATPGAAGGGRRGAGPQPDDARARL